MPPGSLAAAPASTSPTMRVAEAARLLSVSDDTVLRWFHEGQIRGRKSRGVVLLSRASVEALLPPPEPMCSALDHVRDLLAVLSFDERRQIAREVVLDVLTH